MPKKYRCSERRVQIDVTRLVVIAESIPKPVASVALVLLASPPPDATAASSSFGGVSLQSIPRNTLSFSDVVQLGDRAVSCGSIDTKGSKFGLTASVPYRHHHSRFDPFCSVEALEASKTLTLAFVGFPADCPRGKLLVLSTVALPLPTGLFLPVERSNPIDPAGHVDVVFLGKPSSILGHSQTTERSMAVCSLALVDGPAHQMPQPSSRQYYQDIIPTTTSSDDHHSPEYPSGFHVRHGAHGSVASRTKRVAQGVQRKAKRLFDRVRSAFDTSSDSAVGASDGSDTDAPSSLAHSQEVVQHREGSAATHPSAAKSPLPSPKHLLHNPPLHRTNPSVEEKPLQRVIACGPADAGSVVPELVWHDAPQDFVRTVNAQRVGLSDGSVHVLVCEIWSTDAERALRDALRSQPLPMSAHVVLIRHTTAPGPSSMIADVMGALVALAKLPPPTGRPTAQTQHGDSPQRLPCLWCVASDNVMSRCFAWAAAQRADIAFAMLSPPTLALGFDDIPRGALRILGTRTPPPRGTAMHTVLQRLSSVLTALALRRSLLVVHAFPITKVVVEVVSHGASHKLPPGAPAGSNAQGTLATHTVTFAFSKCLHILCASGVDVRYEGDPVGPPGSGTDDAGSSDNNERKVHRMLRNPVLIGLYRVPCQGQFEFAYRHTSGTPPLRMWTTRKHTGGLTVESNAIAPDFLCTSLYGQEVTSLKCKPSNKKRMLAVFADADRMPLFDRDGTDAEPAITTTDGHQTNLLRIDHCVSVSIQTSDEYLAPLIPLTS